MSYSNPNRRTYSFSAIDFGTSGSRFIIGPKGKTGHLVEIHASVTTTFTATTTAGRIDIGNSTSATAYQQLSMGTTAAGVAISTNDGVSTVTTTLLDIPADTQVKISSTAPTGGTPAGVATFQVTIDWAD
jgi:3D (Asp-Asp-Asp) domain-containing protein